MSHLRAIPAVTALRLILPCASNLKQLEMRKSPEEVRVFVID
jgi:hypothetical protein